MRKPAFLAIAVLLCLAVLASGTAAGAAAPSHGLALLLAGEISEPGHIPLPPPDGDFEDACGAAIAPDGDIYISDYYHRLIYVYDSTPEYMRQTATEGNDGPCNLAFDEAGDLYVNNWRRNVVRYVPDGSGGYEGAVVIDPDGSTGVSFDPATDRIYVDDRTYVAVYEPSGAPVLVGGLPLRIGLGSLGSGYGVAVSDFPATAGDIYVADAAAGVVRVYAPGGEELAPIAGLGTPEHGFVSLVDSNVLVTPTDGHLYVADNLEPGFEHPALAVDEFNPAGEYRGQLPHKMTDAEPSALALGPTGNVYVTSGNDEDAILYGFTPTFSAHRLAVSSTGAGAGEVSSEPAGIDCGGACAAEYNVGEEVTLTAVVQPGSIFLGWAGGGCSGTALCHLTMAADTTLSAEFGLAPSSSAGVASPAPTADVAGAAQEPPQAAPPDPAVGTHPRRGLNRRHRRHRAHRPRRKGTAR